ncbi:MAG TPA: DNA primase [Symbiobacteriaceae bacterium]
MALFDQAFKEEVRSKNDIVEVISSYVRLERRGNRYVGLCPFHAEKTPSFNVIPDLQIYHCFGCKASGDVFKFIQEREHMTFYEALVFLARRARIPLPREERTPEEERRYRERQAMYEALDMAARYFHSQLFEEAGQKARAYLQGRGITEETMRQFRLGWAPGHGSLFRALRSRFSPEILVKAGLIQPRREGTGYVDVFFERVMFPITDLSGRVIGFGGRILEGEGPKYKNTAETPLFVKRHVLFGLAQAKEAIRASNQAVLVEGYMDVITPHQWGIRNVVAPLGTALTDEQCRVLRQQAEQVVVAFDADTAGQLATLRGLEKLYDSGCDVRILHLPDGKDPDEYIRTHGPEGFRQTIAEAIPLVEFKLKLALGGSPGRTPEAKAKALDAVARVLADLKNDLLREEYTHRVANELAETPLEVPEMKRAIARQMNRLLRKGFQYNESNFRNNTRDTGFASSPGPFPPGSVGTLHPLQRRVTDEDRVRRAERTLVQLLLQYPMLLGKVEAELGEAPLSDPGCAAILQALREAGRSGVQPGGSVVPLVIDLLGDSDAAALVTELAAEPPVSVDPEQEVSDCIEKIQQHRVSRRIADLEKLFQARQAAGEAVEPAAMYEYMQLQAKLKKPSKS